MVQDPAAHMVVMAAQPRPQDTILDVCAAPGGKSLAAAIAQGNQGDILACDIHPHKLQLIEKNAGRLGITCIRTALADGRERHAAWLESADIVLTDVPCSGLGIIRKKPDIRYKNRKDLAALPDMQSQILENASAYVRPGRTCLLTVQSAGRNELVTVIFGSTRDSAGNVYTPGPVGGTEDRSCLPQRSEQDGVYI